jgi:hypothetical protein
LNEARRLLLTRRGPSFVGALRVVIALLAVAITVLGTAWAGPPYVTDDPEPTDPRHYEIYLFTQGTNLRGGTGTQTGMDFNYGGMDDLQLTAVVPVAYVSPAMGSNAAGLGNVELAAKYRFLRQSDVGWDVAAFPGVFLPSSSAQVGERHASVVLPIWLEKDWDDWSTFGGGGCTIDRGGDSRDFCLVGWALVRQILPDLQIGAEIVHQTPDVRGGRQMTGVGAGLRYDINDTYHLLAYAGPGLQNAATTDRYSWYASVLFTF